MVPFFVTIRKTNGTTSVHRLYSSSSTAAVHCAALEDETRGTRQTVSSTVSSAGLLLVREDNLGVLPLEPSHFCSSGAAITAVCGSSFCRLSAE